MSDRVGQQLGNYRLVALLGRGGYAEVYLGQHVRLHLQAAIKLLQTHLTGKEAEHFQHEAQTIASLTHPAIVRVFDFDVQDGVPFLVMDYAPNGSLRRRYPKGSVVPLPQILSSVKQVAAALQYAHDQKVIHRDVKPENMLLGRQEQVLLSDFGIATVAHSTASLSAQAAVGTLANMAPEQLQGHPRPASDQYALAVTVYEWLCGARPFAGSFPELVTQHLWQSPPPLQSRAPTISSEVEQVVLRALAKDPKSRFACVQDFALALERAGSSSRVFSAPSRGEATVAVDPSGRSLVQSQLSAQLSSADEPGVEPALVIESDAAAPTMAAGPVHARPLWRVPTSLTSFVGRQQDVETITALLMRSDVHLLTLTGPGGIGKTRLSLQVAAELADRFADGVCFVNLAPLSDAELVVPTIAQVLGVREQGHQPLLDSLKDSLRDRHLLLLLDNFEQVISAAVQVAELLAACPTLKIIVTSRVVLHVQAEREYAVPPLSLPNPKDLPNLEALSQYEAVALFIQRAQAVKADFALTAENAAAIAAICQQVDGLPLAIELAAGRSKLFSPQALLPRLQNRLKLLVGGARDAPMRQQTLRGTIAWSYDLLEEDEKALFRRLAIFAGGCALEAAEAVCNAHGDLGIDVLDGVARLMDKSLLRQEEQAEGETRFWMLQTLREFGLECLASTRELEATRTAHALYYLRRAKEAEPHLRGAESGRWFARLEQEHENLRAAMRWSLEQGEAGQRMETALCLGVALRTFWVQHNHYNEGRTFLEGALAGSKGVVASVRAKALEAAGRLALEQGDYDQVEALCQESLALFRLLGDTAGTALSLLALGLVARQRGNFGAARAQLEEALQLFREVGDKYRITYSLYWLANLARDLGEYARAQALYEESLAIQRELEDSWGIARSLTELASLLFFAQSDPAKAGALLEESLMLLREMGDKASVAESLGVLGQVVLRQGNAARARLLLEESLVLSREMSDKRGIANALSCLGRTVAVQGDGDTARALYEEGLALAREIDDKLGMASYLYGLADVVATQGEPARAARLWSAAQSLRVAIGMPLPPVYRAEYDRTVEGIRAQLDEAAFAEAWNEGGTTPLEQVIAYALETKGALPADAKLPETKQKDASSDLPLATLLSPPSPPLSPRRALKQHFGGLTTREREVARLVAQGKSNRAIADELVVGISTVEAHITHIFTKLGFSSRAQIAAWAVEKGLTKAPQDLGVPRQKH